MRLLVEADDPKHARRLLDRLVAERIDAEIRPEGGAQVWVIDEGDLPRAKELVTGAPVDEAKAARRAAEVRRERGRQDEAHAQQFVEIKQRWGGPVAFGMGPLTLLLVVCSLAAAVLQFFAEDPVGAKWVLTIDHYESLEPLARVRQGEVWRLITPMFLHFGLLHLGFNMYWLYRFGRQLESNHGTLGMLLLVLVSEVVGNLGQYAFTGPSFGGMSGVNYALFGFVWMNARYHRRYTYQLRDSDTFLLMGWLVVCAIGWVGPIANIGHAGGLIVGLLFGLPPYIRQIGEQGTRTDFSKGSWADVNVKGFRRFSRRFVQPYVPLWFLAVAAVIIVLERPTFSPFVPPTVNIGDLEAAELIDPG